MRSAPPGNFFFLEGGTGIHFCCIVLFVRQGTSVCAFVPLVCVCVYVSNNERVWESKQAREREGGKERGREREKENHFFAWIAKGVAIATDDLMCLSVQGVVLAFFLKLMKCKVHTT